MFLRIKPNRFTRDPKGNHSLHHSINDGMAYSIMVGAGETYFTAFALFLKVTTAQVGLINTLPPLIGSLAQLLSVWINRRINICKPIILAGVTTQAFLWLPLLALVLIQPEQALLPLLVLLTLYYASAHLAVPTWIHMMGNIVPERRRGRYFAHRNRLTSIMTLIALILAGVVLHAFDDIDLTWAGFATIFIIAFFARLISAWHIKQMHEPEVRVSTLEDTGSVLKTVVQSDARWFTLYFVLMQVSVSIASPFFGVYMLRDLQFTYIEFMLNTGTVVLVQFTTYKMWGRLGDIFGHRLIIIIGGMTIPMLPALWIVSDHFWYLIMVEVLAGLVWGAFNLGCSNLLFEVVPTVQRVSYVAIHNVLVATGTFVGGLIGIALIGIVPERSTWLGDQSMLTPLLNVFLISTLLRFTVSALFLNRIRKQDKPHHPRLHREFIYRVSRFNSFMGLIYDFVSESKTDKEKQEK